MKIPVVNEEDEILRYEDYKDRNSKDIIRVSALWVTDSEGNILLAQRAFNKKTNPGLWGPAVAGTVEEGETYEENMIKEAEEEIGLKDFEFKVGPKLRRSSSHEYFAQVFISVITSDYPFVLQREEVENAKWFSQEELDRLIQEKPDMFLLFVKEYKKYKL